ncbi:MAG: arginine--tRNA ligase [Chloroflexi bacterium]|nr:arginine--tRNA ligase [Chloroflexota bacterium]
MLRSRLSALLSQGLSAAQAAGAVAATPPVTFTLERREDDLAHYSSSEALRLARIVGAPPRAIAQAIVAHLPPAAEVSRVETAGPGFINFWIDDAWVLDQLRNIVNAGSAYGGSNQGRGASVQVEYVSANPTGPLTAGAGRGGVVGDALARLLETCGYDVTREYYVNDAGHQVEILGLSVYHHYAAALGAQAPFPADGYRGAYIAQWAAQIAQDDGSHWLGNGVPSDPRAFEARAVAIGLAEIRRDLDDLGIEFDVWFSEQAMRDRGAVDEVIQALHGRGFVAERDGAVWFIGGAVADDRENVLVRSRGDPTYFAVDIAYHQDKFQARGFERVIDVWGADHHGHVPRMHAAMEALDAGADAARLEILVTQMVGIRTHGELGRQGKRSGKFVTLREVLDEVGPAATRYFFLSKAIDSQMEFDLELAKREDPENPVYYIQMAHARCAGIQRTAATMPSAEGAAALTPDDVALARRLLAFPEIVADACLNREPHRVTHFLLDLARTFHSYYNKHRVVTQDAARTARRLQLVRAVRQVLANGLGLLGIPAPERM